MELVTPPRPGEQTVKVETDWNIISLDKNNTQIDVYVRYNGKTMCSASIKCQGDVKILQILAQNIDLIRKKLTSNLVVPLNGSGS